MKIFIVEDYDLMRMLLKRTIKKNLSPVEIRESESAEGALERIPLYKPDAVLVDISLPGLDGIELIRTLKNKHRAIYILIVTGPEIEFYRQTAIDAGACDVVSKGDDTRLIDALKTWTKDL